MKKHTWSPWEDVEIHHITTIFDNIHCYLIQIRTRDDGKKQFRDVLISKKVELGTRLNINLK